MYEKAEQELANLLTAKPFPALMGVPAYMALLVKGQPDATLCAKAAKNIVARLASLGGVREFGSRQAVAATVWTTELCRGLGPATRVDGEWWFEVELVKRWERVYAHEMPAKRRDKVLEALRPMLAICRDWNDLLKLASLKPGAGGIPVLTGQGAPQPIFSKDSPRYNKGGFDQKKFDEEKKVMFIGGFQQIYVPFAPVAAIGPYV